jgi:glycosyltransferase involved in cell wall biosynthesis
MRSVFVDSTLTTPPFGGATTFLAELCCALADRGERATVIARPGPDESVVQRLRAGGVEVRLDLWRSTHLPEQRAQRLADWVNGEAVDVYVVSISPDAGWLALPLLIPSIATMSVVHADGPAFYSPLKHYAQFIDCAVGVSKSIQDRIFAECSVPPSRGRHIPYGVPLLSAADMQERSERTADEPFHLAYLGRLVQGLKRVLDLIPLATELKRRGVRFELNLIGDGEERGALAAGFAAAQVSSEVRFWGWLSPAQVRQRLRELDAVVLLSDSEGLPLALLESMGHGVVPIVTRIKSGLTEVVREGDNGFLVEVGDMSTFADRVALLAKDRERLSQMRLKAWETSQDFSLDKMVTAYEHTFKQLAAARQSAPAQSMDRDYPVMASCRSRYPFWLRKLKSYAVAAGLIRDVT